MKGIARRRIQALTAEPLQVFDLTRQTTNVKFHSNYFDCRG
jgi:hypothetical protein